MQAMMVLFSIDWLAETRTIWVSTRGMFFK